MSDFQERPAFYAILPATVRYDKDLKPIERLLYAEITSLCNAHGYCYATSSYFAELYEMRRESISRCISHLERCGYIRVEVTNDEKTGSTRKIFLTGKADGGCDQKVTGGVTKKSQGCDQKITPGCDQKVTQNNINNYTIPSKNINTKENKRESAREERHRYGQYKNVLLSDKELETLKEEFPADWQARIERVSEYCASSGKNYKSYLATIRNWARRDKEKANRAPARPVRKNDAKAGFQNALEILGINEESEG